MYANVVVYNGPTINYIFAIFLLLFPHISTNEKLWKATLKTKKEGQHNFSEDLSPVSRLAIN